MRRIIMTILALGWTAGLAACSADEPGGLPDPPTELSAELDASSGVVLTWNDADEEKNYVVKRQAVGVDGGFVVIAELPADTVMYKDIKVASGKTYRYQVLSENPYGESASEEVTIDVP
jgi:fibronectin type 3 domain-containing protein